MAAAYVAIVMTALQYVYVVLRPPKILDYRWNVRFWHRADNPTVLAFVRYGVTANISSELRYGKQKR